MRTLGFGVWTLKFACDPHQAPGRHHRELPCGICGYHRRSPAYRLVVSPAQQTGTFPTLHDLTSRLFLPRCHAADEVEAFLENLRTYLQTQTVCFANFSMP